MIKFKLADGSYMDVAPEHLEIFKQRHPKAVRVGGEDATLTGESIGVKDVDLSSTGLFFNVLQQTNPGPAKTLSALASFSKGVVDITDQIADFAEMTTEMQWGGGGGPQGYVNYFAKRLAASTQGISVEEFDETNPYNVVQLSALSNVLDKAIIKHKDKETGKPSDFIDLFQKG